MPDAFAKVRDLGRLKYIQQPKTLEPSYAATCVGPLRDSRTSVL